MLLSLKIENFALIDSLELEFGAGLNVLTGETGAGKSIILDAIDAALGGKVSQRAIRTGAERAVVEATFKLIPALMEWLSQHEIEPLDEDQLICTRELGTSQGSLRSRSRLNGVLVNKQQMEDLRDRLVEITAQGQTVQLGQPSRQRELLDSFGGQEVFQVRAQVAAAFTAWRQAEQALEQRQQSEHQRLQRLDLLQFQVKELQMIDLQDGDELAQLEQERQRLSHSVELQQQSYRVYEALYQNEQGGMAAADLLGQAESTLSEMLAYDPQLQPILDLVSEALAQIEEAGRQINTYAELVETDPQRLQEVEERIGRLKQICRKYGPTLAEVIAYWEAIQTELAELTGQEQSLEALEQAYRDRQYDLQQLCATLTTLRQKNAQALQDRLVQELKPLAMEKVQFQVEVTPIPPTQAGADQVQFLFSPNPGEPLQPLLEIASGGEMSRFLLALKTSFTTANPENTLIFDEIDVGVSGKVTQAIAQKLYQLSTKHQVLCVTHQPLIAAMADHHFRVTKQVITSSKSVITPHSDNGHSEKLDPEDLALRTVVRVMLLNEQQRREELAQLAGGQSGDETIAFADALLTQAANLRQHARGATQPKPAQPSSRSASKTKKSRTRIGS